MKFKYYTFRFLGGEITVKAMNEIEAEILAKSVAIQRGWDYTILR
jgi:hypothetical protein